MAPKYNKKEIEMPKLTKQQKEARKKLYDDVNDNWPWRKGKGQFLDALASEDVRAEKNIISRKDAILAQCYHC